MGLPRAGQRVPLTLQEFKISKFFVSGPECVVSREKLISAAWQRPKRSNDRTVHEAWPKLNNFGQVFRDNGYQLGTDCDASETKTVEFVFKPR